MDKFYVGLKGSSRLVFKAASDPTRESHGAQFDAVVGPFRTKRGAMFHAAFGRANPHIHATGNIPVNHFHCPNDCEHPQPFLQNNKWFCGRCYCKYGELVECHPCTTNNC